MTNKWKKTLACILAATTILTSFAVMPTVAEGPSSKEVVAGGYEIDMSDIPKVHFSDHPKWEELYNAAWEFHKGNIKKANTKLNPEDIYYVDEAFDNTIFAWDTLFMMMFDKYGLHQFPTLQALDNFYYQQIDSDGIDDGYICRRISESDSRKWFTHDSTSSTNPPLWAWAEWEQYQVHGDKERFNKDIKGKTVFQRILSHYEFIKRTRIMDNGLYGHTSGDGNGLDDTPNQDWGRHEQTYNDLSIQQAQSAYYIAKIAEEIGDTENQQKYQKEYEDLSALINEKLWSEEGDFYFNLDKNQNFTNIATPTGLWAMSGMVVTPERAQAMIDSYVLNSEKMFRPNGLSTVTYDYSTFSPKGKYWNGSVWSPTSYQFLKGLQAYGYDDLAFQSGVQHLNMLTDVYLQGANDKNGVFRNTLWECYSSEYLNPSSLKNDTSVSRFNFVGWTGALAIGSTIEDVLGVTLSAPKNEVNWNLKLSEECGIDNLYMAGDRISLRADKRATADSGTTITVSATKPFTLNVTIGGVKNTFEVPAGETSYAVEGTENNPAYLGGIVSGFQPSGIDLAGSRDYVLFQNEDDNAVVDGLKKQFGKEDASLYNVNTIGFRNASVQKSGTMEGLAEGKELFEYVKTGERDGFMVMAKAGHDLKTMKLILGVQNAKATVKASLSDASQQNFTRTITAGDKEHVVMVEIPFRAASDGKYLMAEYRIAQNQTGKTGKITLKGVILEDGGTENPMNPHQVVPIDWSSMNTTPLTGELAEDTAQILLNSNKYAVTSWYNDIKNFDAQTGEYLTFGGTGEHQIRPVSHEVMALATSLRLNVYDPAYTGVSKEEATEMTLKMIKSLAYRHRSNTGGGWGNAWQSAFWAGQVAQAGWMMWDKLSERDQEYVKNMTVYEANRFISYDVPYYKNPDGSVNFKGDSKSEENSWNATILQFATAMMPNHENYDKWINKMVELELSAAAAPDDLDSKDVINGMQLDKILNGTNMELDGTVINHDIVHADYMVAIMQNYMNAWAYGFAGKETPNAALFNGDRIYYALTDLYFSPDQYQKPGGTFYTRDENGNASHEMYYPQGNDWGGQRQANYQLMDIIAYVFGEDANCSTKAIEFAKARNQEMLRMQARSEDGRYYQAASEDSFKSREEWVACHIAYSYTALWMKENDMYRFTNEPLAKDLGTLTHVALDASETIMNASSVQANVDINDEVKLYMNDQNSSIVYQSSNDNILAVDGNGKISAKFPGKATLTVTVTYNGVSLSDAKEITVLPRREMKPFLSLDFEDGSLPQGWQPVLQLGSSDPGDWTVLDDNGNKVLNQSKGANSNNNVMYLMDSPIGGDLVMSADIKMNSSGSDRHGAGLVFRYQDPSNYYTVSYYYGVIKIERRKDGVYTNLVTKNMKWNLNTSYNLGIKIEGNTMTLLLDGEAVISAKDENLYPSGQVGFVTTRTNTNFDNVNISAADDAEIVQGDINQDGLVGVSDLLLIKSHILGRIAFEDIQKMASDVNHDGLINIFDLVMLKMQILRG